MSKVEENASGVTGEGQNGSQPSARSSRVPIERELPYVATLYRGDRSCVFDGNEANFPAWKWRVEHHLNKMRLLHTLLRTPEEEDYARPLEGATAQQEAARKEKMKKRMEEDMDALDEIVLMVNNQVLNKLIGLEYAKEAMDVLVRTYQKVGTGAMISMRDRLFNLKHKKFENLQRLFDEFDMIVRELERMQAGLTQAEKIHALIIAMPSRFKHVKGALTVLPNDELCRKPLGEIKRMFLDADENVGEMDGAVGDDVALKTNKSFNVCFGCGQTGHYKNKCPVKKKKNNMRNQQRQREHQNTRNQQHQHEYRNRSDRHHALMTGVTGRPARKVRFVVDSGASDHMINDERMLEDVEELEEPVVIATAKAGTTLRGTKRGKVRLNSVVGLNKIKKT